ncbi:hypothetical protein [Haloferula sp.]|uniref:hypothetical protein n=1 Tax=Haloferula sp. TaxID=2497595 RepID=UPI003C772028
MKTRFPTVIMLVGILVACERHESDVPKAVAVPDDEASMEGAAEDLDQSVAEGGKAADDVADEVEEAAEELDQKPTPGERLDQAIGATGRGLQTAGEKTEQGVKTAVEKTEEGVKKGAAATGRFIRKVGEKIEGAATPDEKEE